MKRFLRQFLVLIHLIPGLVFADSAVMITEIGACFPGDSEWIEVTNTSEEAVDLTTWKFHEQEINHSIRVLGEGRAIVPPRSSAIIVDKWEDFSALFPDYSGPVFDSSWGSLKNSGERIGLQEDSGAPDLSTLFLFPPCESGKTLERIALAADAHLSTSWKLSREKGTPGVFKGGPDTDLETIQDKSAISADSLEVAPFESLPPKEETKKEKRDSSAPVPGDIKLLISEVATNRSVKNGSDFVELYVKSVGTAGRANLKDMKVKYKGRSLVSITHDFWVEAGDFILIKINQEAAGVWHDRTLHEIGLTRSSGLSKSSGTIEVILFAGTSQEHTTDVLCWKNKKLSTTEEKRVRHHIESKNWTGSCYETNTLLKNESIARNITHRDTGGRNDFFPHYNGSPGVANQPHNHSPKAILELQGKPLIAGKVPLAFNVTGRASSDPDGRHDIKSFQWSLNGKVFSEKANPRVQKITEEGQYLVQLRVEDYSGDSSEATLSLEVFAAASKEAERVLISQVIKNRTQELLTFPSLKKDRSRRSKSYEASDHFFEDFWSQVDASVLENIIASQSRRERRSAFPTGDRGAVVPDSITELVARSEGHESLIASQKKERIPPNLKKKAAKNIAYTFRVWREQMGEE